MTGEPDPSVVRLYRPTGQAERDLVEASGWLAWPPRPPEQPIFHPVLNEWYATKIAREWNVPHAGVGYVMEFDVDAAYLESFPVQQVGGRDVLELRVLAEELEGPSTTRAGTAEFRASFAAKACASVDPPSANNCATYGPTSQ